MARKKKKVEAMLEFMPMSWKRLAGRHGGRMFVVSRGDWDRVREVTKKFPEAYEELKALDVRLTPVDVRDEAGNFLPEPLRGRIP